MGCPLMAGTHDSRRTSTVVVIEATPTEIYRALLDPESVATFMAPGEMTAHVHDFDPREDGAFCIELRPRRTTRQP